MVNSPVNQIVRKDHPGEATIDLAGVSSLGDLKL
jgi:hypothetical protein